MRKLLERDPVHDNHRDEVVSGVGNLSLGGRANFMNHFQCSTAILAYVATLTTVTTKV